MLHELRRHPSQLLHAISRILLATQSEITDSLVELLIQIVHSIGAKRVEKELIDDLKRVSGKMVCSSASPKDFGSELVKDVVYPVVSKPTLQALVKEFKATGSTYREKVYTVMRSSYLHHYRRMVPQILDVLEFRSNNEVHRPVISH